MYFLKHPFISHTFIHIIIRAHSFTIFVDHVQVSINPTGRTLQYGPVDYTDDLMDFYCVTRLANGHYFTSPSAILRVRCERKLIQ